MKKIVFTGGGTVGHVTLNLLLMPKFIEDGWEVHYIGDKHGIEHQEILKSGLDVTFHSIATGKLRRYFSWQNMWDVFKVAWGIVQSFFIMLMIRPQALFSKGGFVSVPPVIAARLSMGLANKIAYKFATKMYSTFEQPASLTKVEHVGAVTKVSGPVIEEPEVMVDIRTCFDSKLPTLLFVGGSAGARIFNQLVTDYKNELTSRYNVINLTGDSSLNELSKNLYRVDYVTKLYQPLMNIADVVITRGGANTIFELLAMAKLHVIVPLGREASRGDQIENAAYFVKKGYAEELQESDLNLSSLEEKVTLLLNNKEIYQNTMRDSHELKSVADFYELIKKDLS